MQPSSESLFLAEARTQLASLHNTLRHCLEQLSDEQLGWRPRSNMNSVGNLVLHLCGNLTQRINSVVGGAADVRDRDREFAERGPFTRSQLLSLLDGSIAAADAVLAGLSAATLAEPRSYLAMGQTVQSSVVGVILRTLVHWGGHTQEIITLTRMQLGEAYRFQMG